MADNDGLKQVFASAKWGDVLIGMINDILVIGFKYISSGSFMALEYTRGTGELKDFYPYAGVYAGNQWTFA